MCLVSVIVPAHNAALYLRDALESVAAQTHRNFEAIVVDDGSSDATAEVAAVFARGDSRFRVIRQANAGVGAARNTGIRAARGRYIAPLDADDLWYSKKLEEQVACMERHGPRAGLVYCWTNLHWMDGRLNRSCGKPAFEGDVLPALIAANFINCASVPLFRAAALREVGGYLTRAEQRGAQGCEDWDLSLRIAEKFEVYCARDYLVGYRQSDGMTLNARRMADSFRVVRQRARNRNPRIARRYFRWSAAPFYCWLGSRSYTGRDFRWSLRSACRAVWSDPSYLLNSSVYRLAGKSMVRLVVGPPKSSSRSQQSVGFSEGPPDFHESLFLRIQAARLQRLMQQRGRVVGPKTTIRSVVSAVESLAVSSGVLESQYWL